jgi:hypothetical protein
VVPSQPINTRIGIPVHCRIRQAGSRMCQPCAMDLALASKDKISPDVLRRMIYAGPISYGAKVCRAVDGVEVVAMSY